MIFGGEVELGVIRFYSDDLGFGVLIFVVGLDGGDFFEGYFFSGFFVDLFLYKAVEMGSGEDHPALLPLLEDTGSFDEKAFLNFIIFDVSFVVLLWLHGGLICFIFSSLYLITS